MTLLGKRCKRPHYECFTLLFSFGFSISFPVEIFERSTTSAAITKPRFKGSPNTVILKYFSMLRWERLLCQSISRVNRNTCGACKFSTLFSSDNSDTSGYKSAQRGTELSWKVSFFFNPGPPACMHVTFDVSFGRACDYTTYISRSGCFQEHLLSTWPFIFIHFCFYLLLKREPRLRRTLMKH